MLFQVLSGFKPIFYTTHPNEEPNYYNELAKKYHEKLSNLHDCKVKEKNNIASKLSEDERLLQADNEWLTKFKDQLIRIERG